MRFQKCRFSSRRKRSKTFSSTLALLHRFHLSTLKRSETMKTTGTWDWAWQDHPPSWIDAPIWTGTECRWCFLRHRFQKSPFPPVHTRNEAFPRGWVFKSLHLCSLRASSRGRGVVLLPSPPPLPRELARRLHLLERLLIIFWPIAGKQNIWWILSGNRLQPWMRDCWYTRSI